MARFYSTGEESEEVINHYWHREWLLCSKMFCASILLEVGSHKLEFTRITACVLNTFKWKRLQITIILKNDAAENLIFLFYFIF